MLLHSEELGAATDGSPGLHCKFWSGESRSGGSGAAPGDLRQIGPKQEATEAQEQ